MHAGLALKATVDGLSVGVIYTAHFVERYEKDIPTRPAAKRTLSEGDVRDLVLKALPQMVSWFKAGYTPDTLIRARAKNINMSVSMRKKGGGGLTVIMKNIMVKQGYQPSAIKDYVIELNPEHTVHFLRKMDRDLKIAVADHLAGVIEELEPNATYDLETPEAEYTVDIADSDVYIEDADWLEDMVVVDV